MAFTIRPITGADRVAVLRLFAAHLAELGYAPNPVMDADMAGLPGSYGQAPNVFLVATGPGSQIVGMAGLLGGEIRRVYVRPHWRRHGIGRALLDELVRRARDAGLKEARAVVAKSNLPSLRLFLSCGFVAMGAPPASEHAGHCIVLALAAGTKVR